MKNKAEQTGEIEIPRVMPVLPLRDMVIFPFMIYPVLVGREQSITAANHAMEAGKILFLTTQIRSSVENPTKEDLYLEGTIARIQQMVRLPNGLMKVLVDGLVQGKIVSFTERKEFFEATVDFLLPGVTNTNEIDALVRQSTTLFKEYLKLSKTGNQDLAASIDLIDDPQKKLFFIAANITQSIENKQRLLSIYSLREQYFELIKMLNTEIDILKIEIEIDGKVQENIAKTQRKFIISEQIKILQDELGEDEDSSPEVMKLREAIKEAGMPQVAFDKATEELNKLKKIPPLSPEYTVIRNYLDVLISLPWSKKSEDRLDIHNVMKVLNEDHYGLDKPKERIAEHIAVLNMVKKMRGQILCLVGPPGVGKTSLGRSIARALGREFVRISLGGVRDEAEIRGHRRTYIGSMPGKIIMAMKRAGTVNPVILLDEIDKLTSDFRGDPASAMLEVLDPEQNHTFQDHYLEVDYDLSNVMFITTANVRYTIPLPLQDRMEIIELSSYLEMDKLEIAKRHIIPKQVENHGLVDYHVSFKDDAILSVINNYTREAGVRNLEREIASVLRKTAKNILEKNGGKEKKSRKPKQFVIDSKKVAEFLGIPKYKQQKHATASKVGSVTGLAWTSVGGDILSVDVSIMPGAEKLTLTGQLGEVMRESAHAALSYIRSNAALFGIEDEYFKGKEIHIHLPAGAIPKDGPSAGITLTIAMLSAITGKPVAGDIAMTGEITLRGEVFPIGGLNEKLLAARKNGIKKVLIPKENQIDLQEIPKPILEGLIITPVSTIPQAVSETLSEITMNLKKKPAGKKR
ncbi:MAG: endopeptidase La [Ignavibacteriaceae bacterium]|nr:endopeptidase La [Ignavibacteriaceae bacterium]